MLFSVNNALATTAMEISSMDTNAQLVTRWVLGGETTLEHGLRKLDWMYERIQLDEARRLARPLHDAAVAMTTEAVQRAPSQ